MGNEGIDQSVIKTVIHDVDQFMPTSIKQFFESAFEKSTKVELIQSVITGAKTCEFIIHI